MGLAVSCSTGHPAVMAHKVSILLSLVLLSLLLLLQPDKISSAPVPAPAPAPFTPGIKIGALLGAGLILKAYLIANALSGEKEEDSSSYSSSYGHPPMGLLPPMGHLPINLPTNLLIM